MTRGHRLGKMGNEISRLREDSSMTNLRRKEHNTERIRPFLLPIDIAGYNKSNIIYLPPQISYLNCNKQHHNILKCSKLKI